MARIIGIDYGTKRVGLASTDPLQLIASPLTTVAAHELFNFLKDYLAQNPVEAFVLGLPKNLDNTDSETTQKVRAFYDLLKKKFPDIPIHWIDERFSSKIALDAMIRGGSTKKQRQQKGNIDKVSAAIILQSFLDAKNFLK